MQRRQAPHAETAGLLRQAVGLLYAARALPLLQRANAQRPAQYEIVFTLSVVWFRLHRLDEAANALQTAVAFSLAAAEPLYYLGLVA